MVKGIVRNFDVLGRVVVPKEMRKELKLKEGEPVDIYLENGIICIKPVKLQCVCCGSNDEDKLIVSRGIHMCNSCILDFMEEEKSNEIN